MTQTGNIVILIILYISKSMGYLCGGQANKQRKIAQLVRAYETCGKFAALVVSLSRLANGILRV